MNRPRESLGPGWFKSGHHHGGLTGEVPVVVCLSFFMRVSPRDVSDGSKQPMMVEPGHPFQRRQFHRFAGGRNDESRRHRARVARHKAPASEHPERSLCAWNC